MEFRLSGSGLKTFSNGITCLASVGDDKLTIYAASSQIVFNTLNRGSTACQWIVLKRDFFDDYKVSDSEVRCSVILKDVCSVLRTHITNINALVVRLRVADATRIRWKLYFTDDYDSSLPTRLWIDPAEEFVHYSHSRDPVDMTFSLKDLKTFAAFCESCEVDIHLYFGKAGIPILMAPNFKLDDGGSSNFDSTIMLGTIGSSRLHGGQTSESSLSDEATENVSDHIKIQSDISGYGCFGTVNLARCKLDKQLYAVKIIKFKRGDYHVTNREAKIMAILKHEHIAKYHKSWTDHGLDSCCKKEKEKHEFENDNDNRDEEYTRYDEGNEDVAVDKEMNYSFLCIQMTHYPRTLYDCLEPGEYNFNEELASKWFKQTVKGVTYLHELNIAHGDLKPQNILLDRENNIMIGDFGLAIKTDYYGPQLPERLPLPSKKDDMCDLGEILFRLYHPFRDDINEQKQIEEMCEGIVRRKGWRKKHSNQWTLIKRLRSKRKSDRPSASQLLEELE